ncbi:TetR/AcrR family transcriptional regulator [Pseudonocardia sp. RS010]|uniref:TetR/AcrR family transcriptional regulator n=1 Tax=Pseudonocardia sp. RS010 TaxID=3385979 RepID=UPI00399F4F2A
MIQARTAETGTVRATRSRPGTAARRAEIVAVASRLFRERGYHGVGMRAIAEAADIQAASLYHHFASKEELLLESIYVVDRDLVVDQLPILEGAGTYRERFGRLVRGHVRHIGANRDAWWVAGRELRALSPEKLDEVQVYRRRYQHALGEFLAAGAAAGEFSCEDPRLSALAVLDMINGPNEWWEPGGRLAIDELAARYAALALRLVGAEPAPGAPAGPGRGQARKRSSSAR